MSKLERIFLNFFNFFGILGLKLSKYDCLKVSKSLGVINYVKTFSMLLFRIFYAIHIKSNIQQLYNIKHDKKMSIMITDLVSITFIALIFCVFFIQNFKRNEICKCLEKLRKLNLTEKSKKTFKWKFLGYFSIFLIFFLMSIFYLIFLVVLKFNFTVFMFIFSNYVQIAALLLYFLIKMIEELLVIKLEEILNSLEISLVKKQTEEFQEILSIFEDFQNAFGLQLTINMAYFSGMLSIIVSFMFYKTLKFSNFEFFIFSAFK